MEETNKQELIKTLAARLNRAVRMYLDNCTRCGVCIESCHAYASMPDIKYSPVGRAQNIRRLYEKYFKGMGKIAPWLTLEHALCRVGSARGKGRGMSVGYGVGRTRYRWRTTGTYCKFSRYAPTLALLCRTGSTPIQVVTPLLLFGRAIESCLWGICVLPPSFVGSRNWLVRYCHGCVSRFRMRA